MKLHIHMMNPQKSPYLFLKRGLLDYTHEMYIFPHLIIVSWQKMQGEKKSCPGDLV